MFIPKHQFKKFMDGKRELKEKYGQAKEYHGETRIVVDVGTNKIRVFEDGKWWVKKIDLDKRRQEIERSL